MRQLLWKEWHEQAWKLAFGAIVLTAAAVIGLHARMVPDATLAEWVCGLGMVALPVLASTGLVPAERAEGSLESLVALPVSPGRILAAKAALGLLLCVGPLAAAAVASVAMAGGREMTGGDLVALYARSAAAAVALFAWMLALTVRLPTEARAAMVAVGVIVLWLLAAAGLGDTPHRWLTFALTPFALVYDIPGPPPGSPNPLGPGPQLWLVVVVQAVLTAAAGWLAARLFARSTEDMA